MKKFLTAKWHDLIMANYEVEPELLAPRLPGGTEIDLYDGKCFVSLVGFMFVDTRVMDFLIPFHVNFEEVNLRFYVRRETDGEVRRGVVFIKEIVPRAAIAAVARRVYGEPYERWAMSNFRDDEYVAVQLEQRRMLQIRSASNAAKASAFRARVRRANLSSNITGVTQNAAPSTHR